ncbi:cadherin-related family member 1, partial [Elysia marginata]
MAYLINVPYVMSARNYFCIHATCMDLETMDKENHSATAEVFIKVEDVQDTAPEFYRDSYSITIPENALKGFILQPAVEAIDGDRGVPNRIALSILNETCPQLLSIDATSGALSVEKSPDRDEGIIHIEDGICIFFIQ